MNANDGINVRRTEYLCKTETDAAWLPICLCDVKKGQSFRMFEPDGTPITDEWNDTVFVAETDGWISEDGMHVIQVSSVGDTLHASDAP